MSKIEAFRLEVLKNLQKTFHDLEIAAVLRGTEDGLPTNILNVLHTEVGLLGEEVMGEYYFLPIPEENPKFHLFSAMITLSEEVDEDKFALLGLAANKLNFYLPVGSFVFSEPESIMAFKYTSLIPFTANEEEALTMIDGSIGFALQLVDRYVDIFVQLGRGEATLEEFIAELPDAYNL